MTIKKIKVIGGLILHFMWVFPLMVIASVLAPIWLPIVTIMGFYTNLQEEWNK